VIAHLFALHVPAELAELLALMDSYGDDARALAGGTVLLPEMGRGTIRPPVVVDVSRAVRPGVTRRGEVAVVGATTTYRQLESETGLLGGFARRITGGAQIRNRATIGGSAAWANPSSDAPAVLLALGARMVVASVASEQRVPAERFFVDAFRTTLGPGEVVVAIEVPVPPAGARFGYEKLTFGESSWPIVTAAAVVSEGGGVRLAVGGASAVPIVVELPSREHAEEAVAAAVAEPWADVLASADYRRRVAPVIARRAMAAAS
jgi:aerobic carbon-monoxide dehydrogenase medium subunit